MRQEIGLALVAPALLALSTCVPPHPVPGPPAPEEHVLGLRPVPYASVPGWNEDDPAQALPAFQASCTHMATMGPGETLGGTGEAAALGGTPDKWRPACAAAASVPAGDRVAARAFFERWLQPFAVSDAGKLGGLFTGYYEPQVAGSRTPGGGFATPLLGRPGDLVQADLGQFSDDLKGRKLTGRVSGDAFVPYWDRAQIEAGVLADRHLELLWLADPIDAFVLQIQGSGRINLPDGHVVRVSYAGQNGRPYVPIGRVLVQQKAMALDQVSMQSIRAWLVAHPDQAAGVMDQNPSYVFFREIDGMPADEGPPGALGVPIVPGRSIAIDKHFLPLGAPVFVVTTDPLDGKPFRRLMQAQDLGGAIRGPVRADIFWGWGADAEARAGKMRAQGSEYVLLPRPTTPTAAAS